MMGTRRPPGRFRIPSFVRVTGYMLRRVHASVYDRRMGIGHFGAAYVADRAAGLAGIPRSTLHYWAREGIWTPSVSDTRVKLWSYADLLGLRLIDWLRQDKDEFRIPRSSMKKIRAALASVESFGQRLQADSLRVWVDRKGGIVLGLEHEVFVALRGGFLQRLVGTEVDLIDAFASRAGVKAPNLMVPRPTLRIIPGKLSGEPHVMNTRIPTTAIVALKRRGLQQREIVELYPGLVERNVEEAIDLEEQLEGAFRPAAA